MPMSNAPQGATHLANALHLRIYVFIRSTSTAWGPFSVCSMQ
jgi:hypothetical protein